MKEKNSGFTLIELMIAIVIIGILAAVAYPSYTGYLLKARRTDGTSALTTAAQMQERRFTANGSYTDNIALIGGNQSPKGYYTIGVTIPSTAGCTSGTKYYCFTLTAAPVNADPECGNLTLDHTGAQGATGTTPSKCW